MRAETVTPATTPTRPDPATRPKFPQPIKINDRKFYRRSELDWFKLSVQAQALGRPPPPKLTPPAADPFVTHKVAALEFGVSERSLDRWVASGREREVA